MGTIIKPINKSKNHLVLINDINFEVRNTYNKALFSLHDTKLDEKLENLIWRGWLDSEIQNSQKFWMDVENMCQIILRMMLKECGCNSNPFFQLYLPWSSKSLSFAQICDLLLHPFSLVPWEQSTWGGGCSGWVFFNPFNLCLLWFPMA